MSRIPVNPEIPEGTEVEVYWNLHRNLFSVRDRTNGLVIAHATDVNLTDVTFRVSEAGRQRVLREKRKNVHAFVRGKISAPEMYLRGVADGYTRVTYNPYKAAHFRDVETDRPLSGARFVRLLSHFDSNEQRGTILAHRTVSLDKPTAA